MTDSFYLPDYALVSVVYHGKEVGDCISAEFTVFSTKDLLELILPAFFLLKGHLWVAHSIKRLKAGTSDCHWAIDARSKASLKEICEAVELREGWQV